MHEILLALVIVYGEAFGADRTLVNRLPFNVSDQSHSNCRQAHALQRHPSSIAATFLPAVAAADSPDTERRSGRPHHFRTPLSGRFCWCA